MNDSGQIVNAVEDHVMTADDMKAMRENVIEQVRNKGRKKGPHEHVRLSLIWNCQQDIRKIQRQLVEGYSFDYNALQALVNTMFGFINGIVDPNVPGQSAQEVEVEEIVQ